jgi:hypothetical protein
MKPQEHHLVVGMLPAACHRLFQKKENPLLCEENWQLQLRNPLKNVMLQIKEQITSEPTTLQRASQHLSDKDNITLLLAEEVELSFVLVPQNGVASGTVPVPQQYTSKHPRSLELMLLLQTPSYDPS